MKLLIVTQAVDTNDPVLGFFHRWLVEFAKNCEQVTVCALRVGEHNLPSNVTVVPLRPGGRGKLLVIGRFYYEIISRRSTYDAVFVHMNPEYVVLGGLVWRLMGKRISLWYTHKHVGLRLRIAELLANTVFTASKASFRLHSKKLRVMGHGLDCPQAHPSVYVPGTSMRIGTIGRLTRTKGVLEMLSVLDVLHVEGKSLSFTLVGSAATKEDSAYQREVELAVHERPYASCVQMVGAVSHEHVPDILKNVDVFLNFSNTGSLDKAVLEALCAGVPTVVSNEAFKELLVPYGLFLSSRTPEDGARAIEHALQVDTRPLQAYVRKSHSLQSLIPALLAELQKLH